MAGKVSRRGGPSLVPPGEGVGGLRNVIHQPGNPALSLHVEARGGPERQSWFAELLLKDSCCVLVHL